MEIAAANVRNGSGGSWDASATLFLAACDKKSPKPMVWGFPIFDCYAPESARGTVTAE